MSKGLDQLKMEPIDTVPLGLHTQRTIVSDYM